MAANEMRFACTKPTDYERAVLMGCDAIKGEYRRASNDLTNKWRIMKKAEQDHEVAFKECDELAKKIKVCEQDRKKVLKAIEKRELEAVQSAQDDNVEQECALLRERQDRMARYANKRARREP